MIRNFFAFVILLLFIFVLPPLLILFGIGKTFLNESYIRQRVIPESFEVVTGILSEQFSRKPSEIKLFKERITRAVTRERYMVLLQSVILREDMLELDFSLLKSELRNALPDIAKGFPPCESTEDITREFRFCKPTEFSGETKFESLVMNILEKQLPEQISFRKFTTGADSEVALLLRSVILTKRFLPIIAIMTGSILLGLIALIIFSPMASVLKWTGAAMLSLVLMMAIFLVSVLRLPELLSFPELLTPGQIELFTFLSGHLFVKLKSWTFLLGAFGILLFGSGIVVQSRRVL